MGLINATGWDAADDLAYALAHGEIVRFAFKLVCGSSNPDFDAEALPLFFHV